MADHDRLATDPPPDVIEADAGAAPVTLGGRGIAFYVATQLLRRAGQLVLLLVVVSTILFVLVRTAQNPAAVLAGEDGTPEAVARIERYYGLDRPLYEQYGVFLGQLVRLDFGVSVDARRDALGLVLERIPATLQLATAAIALTLFVSLVVGSYLGYRPERTDRRAVLFGVLVSQGIPGFVIGLLLIQIFAVELRAIGSIGNRGLASMILPSVTLASFLVPRAIRLTAANVDQALRENYVRTARAVGLSSAEVLRRHALPNALLGTLALVGVQFAFLMSGSLITESLFAWPGVGRLLIEAVRRVDFPVVQASVFVVAVLVFVVNAVVDLIFPFVDPRLRTKIR